MQATVEVLPVFLTKFLLQCHRGPCLLRTRGFYAQTHGLYAQTHGFYARTHGLYAQTHGLYARAPQVGPTEAKLQASTEVKLQASTEVKLQADILLKYACGSLNRAPFIHSPMHHLGLSEATDAL